MWTYLAILFSLSVLLAVFIRRFVITWKKRSDAGKNPEVVDEPEEEEAKKLKRKLSKDEIAEVEKLSKRGVVLLNAGKDEEAIKCFVQALAIDRMHTETQQRLAMLYLQKQMLGAAAALFRELAEATKDPVHYSHLGLALYQQSEFEEAKVAYQTAVDLDPERPQRFVSLAQVYRAMGQVNNAIVALGKALEMDRENLDFLFLLADLQVELGDLAQGEMTLRQILALDPEHEAAKALLEEVKKPEPGQQ